MAAGIVTELEKRGIDSLLVEGGARILAMFLAEGMADEVRRAVNPRLTLGPERGGARFVFHTSAGRRMPARGGGRHGGHDLHAAARHLGRRPRLSGSGGRRGTALHAERNLLLCRSGGRTPDGRTLRATPTKLRPRTTPSRRPSARRWMPEPICAVRRSTPRWSRVRNAAANPRAARS